MTARSVTDATTVRTRGQALRVFFSRKGPRTMLGAAAASWAARLVLGPPGPSDLLAVAAALGVWPFQEWLLHKHVLHLEPFTIGGKTIDPMSWRASHPPRRPARHRHDAPAAAGHRGLAAGPPPARGCCCSACAPPRSPRWRPTRRWRCSTSGRTSSCIRTSSRSRPTARRPAQPSAPPLPRREPVVRVHLSAGRSLVRHRSGSGDGHAVAHGDGSPRAACRAARRTPRAPSPLA